MGFNGCSPTRKPPRLHKQHGPTLFESVLLPLCPPPPGRLCSSTPTSSATSRQPHQRLSWATSTSAAAPRAARRVCLWPTCVPYPGSLPGLRRDSSCPAGWVLVTPCTNSSRRYGQVDKGGGGRGARGGQSQGLGVNVGGRGGGGPAQCWMGVWTCLNCKAGVVCPVL